MIRAIAWFSLENYGVFAPDGNSWQKPSPQLSATAEVLALIDRPVKYYGRMTGECRFCLCAASVALRAVPSSAGEIGLIAGGFEGCLKANQEYFRDYVTCGRTMGRGNLFIYTLPSSVLGEVSIALGLTGPSLFIQDDGVEPLATLANHAQRLLDDAEAGRMLALWSDWRAAVCLVVDRGQEKENFFSSLPASPSSPLQLIHEIQSMVQRA
jgi:hypothetical protein